MTFGASKLLCLVATVVATLAALEVHLAHVQLGWLALAFLAAGFLV